MSRLDTIGKRVRQATSKSATAFRGMIRRLVVAASADGLWQVLGHEDESEDDVAAFQGIGFSSRPSATSIDAGAAEVVLVKVGGASGHPVIVATRDESIRVDIDEDETVIFNSLSMVKIGSDGVVEIGSTGGPFELLALKSDVDSIRTYLNAHVHIGVTAGAVNSGIPLAAAPVMTGTTNLKAE